jgi:hypothetical protein
MAGTTGQLEIAFAGGDGFPAGTLRLVRGGTRLTLTLYGSDGKGTMGRQWRWSDRAKAWDWLGTPPPSILAVVEAHRAELPYQARKLPPAATVDTLKPGAKVRRRAGGPILTVERVYPAGKDWDGEQQPARAVVTRPAHYFSGARGEFHSTIRVDALTVVEA